MELFTSCCDTQSTGVRVPAFVWAGHSCGGGGRRKILPVQQLHCHVTGNTDRPRQCFQEG